MPSKDFFRHLRTDFTQKVGAAIAKLEAWTEEELFYRRCYELRHDKKSLAAFAENVDRGILWGEQLPEFFQRGENEFHLLEEMFLTAPDSKNRNVRLIKHCRYLPGFKHKHEFFEIVFVLKGQCTDTIEGKQMVLPAGTLCFIAPETYHTTEVLDDSIVLYLLVRHSTFDEVFVNLLSTSYPLSEFFLRSVYSKKPEYLVFNIADNTELLEQLLAMLVEQNIGDENSNRIMEAQLSIFLSLLNRSRGKSPMAHKQVGIKQQHWEIIAYINKHFRTLTQAKLAAEFNFSIVHCSRIIKSITGKTFTGIVQELRMNQARTMLLASNVKIHNISFSLGYENQESFIRSFKKTHGVSPVQYRKNNSG